MILGKTVQVFEWKKVKPSDYEPTKVPAYRGKLIEFTLDWEFVNEENVAQYPAAIIMDVEGNLKAEPVDNIRVLATDDEAVEGWPPK